MFKILAILTLTFVTPALTHAAAEVDKPAPKFSLKDTNGKTVKLADATKDGMVVLEWLNYDCPFVKKHYESKNMQGLQGKYTAMGVKWFSIISSAPGKQGNFASAEINKLSTEKGAHPTAILLDPDGKVGKLYGAKTTPHMFVINKGGMLAYAGAIDDKPSTDAEDVKIATNYVAAAVDGLMGPDHKVEKKSSTPYGCSVKY